MLGWEWKRRKWLVLDNILGKQVIYTWFPNTWLRTSPDPCQGFTNLWGKGEKKDIAKVFQKGKYVEFKEFAFILRLDLSYLSEIEGKPSFHEVVTIALFVCYFVILLLSPNTTNTWHQRVGPETCFWKCHWSEKPRRLRAAVSTTHLREK